MPKVRLHELIAAIPSAIREHREPEPIVVDTSIIVLVIINILLKRFASKDTKHMLPYLLKTLGSDDFKTAHRILSQEDADLGRRFEEFCSPEAKLLHATPEYEVEGLKLLRACMKKYRRRYRTGDSAQATSSRRLHTR